MIEHCDDIENALWSAAKITLPDHVIRGSTLTQAIVRRSRRYTSERDQLEQRNLHDLAARALFFTNADAAKIAIPLAELDRVNLLPKTTPIRIADIGAGVGAMTLGALSFVAGSGRIPPKNPIDIIAIDNDKDALLLLQKATGFLPDLMQNVSLDIRCANLSSRNLSSRALSSQNNSRDHFDLIFVGHVVNELPEAQALPLVSTLIANLAANGSLIIIEPALRDTTRALHRLRDQIITNQTGHIFAPCTRSSEPCPALDSPDQWCHEDRPITLPRRTQKLAQATGLRQHGLKFSYLTIRRQQTRLATAPPEETTMRVVSRLFKQKGQLSCTVCGPGVHHTIRLLKRNRSEANHPFRHLRRGDILVTKPTTEILPDQPITIIR